MIQTALNAIEKDSSLFYDHESYIDYCLEVAQNKLSSYGAVSTIKNHEIKYLNKNFNHYPKPYESWSILKEYGLNMPLSIKNGYIYFQPVQGDINFLVDTEFFKRKALKPIKAWKSPATTPLAIKNMHMQDRQKGFKKYAESVLCPRLFYPALFSV